MVSNSSTFHVRGVTLNLEGGDQVILNAGEYMTIFPSGELITFAVQLPPNLVFNSNTAYMPPSFTDIKAPKGSIYYSLTSSKLCFNDFSGVSHPLY